LKLPDGGNGTDHVQEVSCWGEKLRNTWTLEPVEGGTLFNYVERLTLSNGFMDKVWGKLGRRSGMGHIEGYLRNLKTLAESRAAEAAQRKAA
jgi:hypothetical protein